MRVKIYLLPLVIIGVLFSQPSDIQLYYPLEVGMSWKYEFLGNPRFSRVDSVIRQESSNKYFVMKKVDAYTSTITFETIRKDEDLGVLLIGAVDAYGVFHDYDPWLAILAPKKYRMHDSESGLMGWVNKYNNGDPKQLCYIYRNVTVETVKGVFRNCIKVEVIENNLDKTGLVYTYRYYAPGVGLVKEMFGEEGNMKVILNLMSFHKPQVFCMSVRKRGKWYMIDISHKSLPGGRQRFSTRPSNLEQTKMIHNEIENVIFYPHPILELILYSFEKMSIIAEDILGAVNGA